MYKRQIVGGLYSIGYTPQQLDSMVNAQNWKFLLSDAPNPKDVLLDDRLQSERYVLSIPFSLKSAAVSDAGIIKGKNLAQMCIRDRYDSLLDKGFSAL